MDAQQAFNGILGEVKKHIAGKADVIELMFIALIANGHILLEGQPGVAKTTMSKALADAVDCEFKRIQGTPDLKTEDIVGFTYLDDITHKVTVRHGPIFTNILLIDELNRAPPKTTAALLEVLEERQATIPGTDSIKLKEPFVAFATQNPLSVDGTTPLPKVLADRFFMKVTVDYPTMEEEQQMIRIKERDEQTETKKILNIDDILRMQKEVNNIVLPDEVLKYITRVVHATRVDLHVVLGGSPRSEISFMRAGKAKAMIEGRKEVSMDDVKFLARPVLSHRLVVRSTGGIGVNGIIDGIIATLE